MGTQHNSLHSCETQGKTPSRPIPWQDPRYIVHWEQRRSLVTQQARPWGSLSHEHQDTDPWEVAALSLPLKSLQAQAILLQL